MWLRRLLPIILLVLITQGSYAMIEELSLSDLVAMSDVVVVATLKNNKNLGPDPDGLMQIENILTIEECLKGGLDKGSEVLVDTLGGWEDSVEFQQGKKALVFLNLKEGDKPRYDVTNYVQGHWPLDDKGLPTGMGTDLTIDQVKVEIKKNLPKPAPKAPPEPEF